MWLEPILDLYLDYWKQMMVLKLINSTFHLLRFLDMPPQTQSKQAHLLAIWAFAYTPTGII
jgi:hypothetical protein